MGDQLPVRAPDLAGDRARDRASTVRLSLAEQVVGYVYVQTAHQAVAWDAVARLSASEAAVWRRMFYGQIRPLMLGARVPDSEFRDFKNHFVLPRENYWGGAIGRAQSWYQNLSVALARSEWPNAAYCLGVLAHYVADALHPLHTAQSEAENDIHFGCDLTTEAILPTLRRLAASIVPTGPLNLADGPDFLAPAIAAGADIALTRYESLLAHFDLRRAVSDPSAGLDAMGQRVMAHVLADQTQLLAGILDRAIAEADVAKPLIVSGTSGWRAALAWPMARLAQQQRIGHARRHATLMLDEITTSGCARKTLPDEERAKRDLFAREVTAQRTPVAVDKVFPFDPRRKAVRPPSLAPGLAAGPALGPAPGLAPAETADADDDGSPSGEVIVFGRQRGVIEIPRPAPRWVFADSVRTRADATRAVETHPKLPTGIQEREGARPPAAVGVGHAAAALLLPGGDSGLSNFRDRRRTALAASSSGQAFPGVEAEQAEMLAAAGFPALDAFVRTDLAQLDAANLAASAPLAALQVWQARARLLATVPGLTAAEAELLSSCGYVSAHAIAEADADKLCADVLAYVTTAEGQMVLSAGKPPDIAKIRSMIEAARAVRAA